MRGWRTLSLQARQLLAASLALVAFLGLTGYALDRAFVDTAQNALRERLADLANGYLSGSELDRSRAFIGSMNLDPRSEILNSEMGVIVDSPPLAEKLAERMLLSRTHLARKLRDAANG